ncbi:MAG: hypothetical protein JNK82_44250 [Myxococcaceae bacterium]|nr:hypothetical protein [Myxococcaceae bacterium]
MHATLTSALFPLAALAIATGCGPVTAQPLEYAPADDASALQPLRDGGARDGGARDGGARDGGARDGGAPPDGGAPIDGGYVGADYGDLRVFDGLNLPAASGGRTLPMRVRWSAQAPQPMPIVIWEHGGGYDPDGHRLSSEWSRTFAKAGYFVVHLAHVAPDAAQLTAMCAEVGVTDPAECDDLSLDGMLDEETEANVFSSIAVARPTDVRRLLDGLPTLASRVLQQQGVVLDIDRVAVAGWSGGSQAPMQLAGALRTVSASLPAFASPDARPVAFVAISPQGPGYSGFFDTSWAGARGPLLVVTGEHDEKPANTLTGAVRRLAYDNLPPGQKHLWYSNIDDPGIAHGSFNLGDQGSTDPELMALSAGLTAVVVGFCDAYVKADPAALSWLAGTGPTAASPGLIEWESR